MSTTSTQSSSSVSLVNQSTGAIKKSGGGELSVRNFLEDHVLFKGLDDQFLSSLTNEIQTRIYNDNDFIIRKGEVGRAMFFVLKGEVNVVSEDDETIINVMKEQSFFGEIGVLFSVPRTATCRAKGRCVILILTKEKLHRAVEPYPKVAEAIALIAEERFQSYVKQKEAAADMEFGEELKLGITKDDLQNVPLFRDCEVGFLHMLALTLKPVQFNQNELLIKKGEPANEMFFVARGIAEVFGEDDGRVYAQFQPGSFFGEVGLFLNVTRTASVRCVTSVINVFKLTRRDMDNVLSQFPEINEKIQEEAKVRFAHNEQRKKAKVSDKMETEVEVVRERLKNVPLFKDGSVGFLHELAFALKLKTYQSMEYVIRKDEIGSSMFFVVEGSADVISDDGKTVYAEMPQYSFFGEVALFFHVHRTASVRAKTTCTLFELSKESLSKILEDHQALKETMTATAAENYELFQQRQRAIEQISQRSHKASLEAYDVEATTDRLKKVSIFSKCDDGFLRSLALTTSINVYKKDELVIRKGDIASEMYFVVSGKAEVISEDGQTVYDELSAGDFFGEVGVLRGISRTATVRVASQVCDIIILTASSLENVLKGYPETYQIISLEAEKRFNISEQRRLKAGGLKHSGSKENFQRNRSGSLTSIFRTIRQKSIGGDKDKKDKDKDKKSNDSESQKEPSRIGSIFKSLKRTLKQTKEEKLSRVSPAKQPSIASSVTSTTSRKHSRRMNVNNILELDEDEVAAIFLFLDPLSRARLRMVCKKWKNMLSDNRFWILNDFRDVFNNTTPKCIVAIAPLINTQLALVNLASCYQIFDEHLYTLITTCPNILSLGISNCWKITDRGLSYIAQFLPQLQALDISYCGQLTGIGFTEHQWSGMRRLDLTYCKQIADEALEKLLSRTADIEELRLRRCTRITDFGLFLVVRHCRYLQSLDIADCEQFSDKCLKWIASSCYNLIHLNLSFCTRITNGGLYDLSLGCQHFENLNLAFCQHLTDAAIIFFAENIKSLRKLSLRKCRKITDAVATFLAKAAPQLVELNVSGCPNITNSTKLIIHSALGSHVQVIMDVSPEIRGVRTPGVGGKPKALEVPLDVRFTSIPADKRESSTKIKKSKTKEARKLKSVAMD
ncbi:hypothetical protein HK098_005849 [Nowakowskiella sp. JEL0407]|nr:hypothetical protein HK098_005849 [Nowakowskiella sp. JEL0407]